MQRAQQQEVCAGGPQNPFWGWQLKSSSQPETAGRAGARARGRAVPAVLCQMTRSESFPTIHQKKKKVKKIEQELAALTSSKGFPRTEPPASSSPWSTATRPARHAGPPAAWGSQGQPWGKPSLVGSQTHPKDPKLQF